MRWPLHVQILVGLAFGGITGTACHLLFPESTQLVWFVNNLANPVGQIFIRLLFMLVIPLVASSLIGFLVAGVGQLTRQHVIARIGRPDVIDAINL